MSKKKKTKKFSSNRCDWHHILFQRRYFSNGYAKRLREHPYCGSYIPKDTLHRLIHSEIANIPLPDDKYCKQALEAINSWLESGYISLDDPIEKKILTITRCFNATAPKTANALRFQHEIVSKFYSKDGK